MMSSISKSVKHVADLDLAGKRLLIRQDLNVPVKNGVVTSDARIRMSLPTLKLCVDAGASILIMSHLGRPTEGEYDEQFSLGPVAKRLGELLGTHIPLITDYLENPPVIASGEIAMLENVRFNVGENKNVEQLSKQYASLCDIYVMDAFGTAHRAQASTYGAGVHAADACAGLLLGGELQALAQAMQEPVKPLLAIVGGSKVSTKLTVLASLSAVVDQLIVGGGIANTFIAAAGYQVGKSLYEADLVAEAARLMESAIKRGAEIPVPVDVVCGKAFDENTSATIKKVSDIEADDLVFDIGPETASIYSQLLAKAGTIVWNGPVGVFEFEQFGAGTKAMAEAVALSSGFSIAGGGDTLAAIDKYGVSNEISYISTGGGAFLEFLEGKKLPAVEMLEARIDV